MSRVGVLSRLHNAVGNLATYIWLRQSFVAISFERCRYFLAHVACRNLPWQGLLLCCYVSLVFNTCSSSIFRDWLVQFCAFFPTTFLEIAVFIKARSKEIVWEIWEVTLFIHG